MSQASLLSEGASLPAYLDLVLQDTPLNDGAVEKGLRQSVYDVNNLADAEELKLDRVRARFARVERFLGYLRKEEDVERAEFGLDRIDSPFAEPIMNRIVTTFQIERDWIDQRLRENRERFKEEFADAAYADEEELLGMEGEQSDTDESPPEAENDDET